MTRRDGRRTWTDEELTTAVASSRSIRQVILKLGLREGGGQYRAIKRRIADLGLDVSAFTGQGWNRGDHAGLLRSTKPIPLCHILVRDSAVYDSNRVKKKVLAAKLIEERCAICGMPPVWNGKRLVLRLDHINGEATDHRIENLRLLCPNCDSQTPTFAGRNKRRRAEAKKRAKRQPKTN